ncbi:MAG: TIGR02452 family protein [[Eubacterium] siraeum]
MAAANGNEALILGAFGCGAFKNPPIVVAKVFAEQLQAFRGCFKAIEFAVFHTEREAGNYNAFKAAIR